MLRKGKQGSRTFFLDCSAQMDPSAPQQVILAVMFIIAAGIAIYALQPVINDIKQPILADADAGILIKVLMYTLNLDIWIFYLFGCYYALNKATNGALSFGGSE